MLVVQDAKTRRGYIEDFMRKRYPRTYGYLLRFKEILLRRPLYKKYHEQANAPFYSQFNISEETFSNYKVVWKAMSNDIYAGVISQFKLKDVGFKAGIPLHTTSFFATNNASEGHFLCAVINSKPVRDFIKSFSSAGRGFGTPSVMEHVGIPKFDPNNELHKKLAQISTTCHRLKNEEKEDEIIKLENLINEAVRQLFNIKPQKN